MGYKIVYGKNPARKKRNIRLPVLIAVFFLLFVIMVQGFFPDAVKQLRSIFLSDTFSDSVQAFVAMVENLSAGESVSEAVETFCQEVFCGE